MNREKLEKLVGKTITVTGKYSYAGKKVKNKFLFRSIKLDDEELCDHLWIYVNRQKPFRPRATYKFTGKVMKYIRDNGTWSFGIKYATAFKLTIKRI